MNTKTIDDNFHSKNLGYVVLKKVYDELNISSILNNKQSSLNIKYSLFDFSLKDLYRSLDYFESLKDDIVKSVWNNTKDTYNRDTSITYYDATNYYFETSYNDEDLIDENGTILEKGIRKKGPSKEHRKTPIIGMGLLMDKNGIPLSYDLFPSNESEKLMMRPTLNKTKAKFNIDRTIIVADCGQNTSDNTVFIAEKNDDIHTNHDGYIYGQSIIGADKEFKNWALNSSDFINDYIYDDDGNLVTYKETIKDENNNILRYEEKPVIFKHKSRVYAKKVQIKKITIEKLPIRYIKSKWFIILKDMLIDKGMKEN